MTSTPPQPPSRPRTWPRRVLEVVACSLLVTCLAALVGFGWHAAFGTRWALAFVIARWIFIACILLLPFVQLALTRRGSARSIPWALRTPWTPLLLTVESVVIDIVSAQLHG